MTAKRRDKPLPGYPVEEAFKTIKEIREYMTRDYDTITCLRCGRKLRGLAYHVWKMHSMNLDEYREMYGIPWTYGLNSPEVSEKQSELAKELVREGKIKGNVNIVNSRKNAHDRPRVKVRTDICRENLAVANKGCDGEESRRRALAPKFGSAEYRAACAARVTEKQKDLLRTVWKGKKRQGERGKMLRD